MKAVRGRGAEARGDGVGMRTPVSNHAARRAEEFAAARDLPAPEEPVAQPRRKVDRRLELFEAQRQLAESFDAGIPEVAENQTSPETYASAVLAAAPSPTEGPVWRTLGPSGMPNGQTYGTGPLARVTVSGRVSSIAVDPTDPRHVLVGAAGGGVWETRDNGSSWVPRTDDAPTLAIGAVAFDPVHTTTAYALTGEGNFYRALGAGLLRSTDGGSTWSVRCTTPFVGQGGYRLVVDPADTTRLFAATTGGLYLSADSGATFSPARTTTCWDVSISPTDHRQVLAAFSDGVRLSTDGGTTWTAQTLPGAPASWSRIAVAYAPSDGSVAYVWAASGATAYLWSRAATTWTQLTVPTGASTAQAWYDWFLAVSPDNPAEVYLSEITLWRGVRSGSTWTWTDIASKKPGSSIHPDQHALAVVPGHPDVIWAGSDGGAFRSDDRGTTWTACNTGLGITEVEFMAQQPGSARWLLAGTQDNGSIRYDGSSLWLHSQDGDGGDCAVDSTAPATAFHTFFGMGMERSTSSGDWGSWTWKGPNVPAGYNALFYPPVEAFGSTVAMAGSSIWISTNDADTFTEVALGFGTAVASAMTIPSATRILVGSTGGHLARVDATGSTWTVTALTSPGSGWISDLAVDPTNNSRLWATFTSSSGARVQRSDDSGSTWSGRNAGLPNLPVNAVQVDPADGNRAWVAADVGVWQTRDAGTSWTAFGQGLPHALIEDLLLQPSARLLRAGTRNRGVWEIDVDDTAFPVCGVQFTGTVPAHQSTRWFTFHWPATWHVVWTVVPTTPAPGAPQITWTTQVERSDPTYATYWITINNLTGAPVNIEGRYAVLSRH